MGTAVLGLAGRVLSLLFLLARPHRHNFDGLRRPSDLCGCLWCDLELIFEQSAFDHAHRPNFEIVTRRARCEAYRSLQAAAGERERANQAVGRGEKTQREDRAERHHLGSLHHGASPVPLHYGGRPVFNARSRAPDARQRTARRLRGHVWEHARRLPLPDANLHKERLLRDLAPLCVDPEQHVWRRQRREAAHVRRRGLRLHRQRRRQRNERGRICQLLRGRR
mmetsp:Transcript_42521/g.93186  ORF Transcript_42521/g.93186 Transcript_42521/m.93186 type:complete len:223 (-) Transcript_42521:153-821(-)